MDLTIVSYNISEGDGDRLGRLARVISAARPNVVALLEATPASALALAAELDCEVVFGEGNAGYHVAWLSRLPVRRAKNHRLPALAKTLLELEVTWTAEVLRLFATHLASSHETEAHPRTGEVAAILHVLREASGRPHILVGDLNALQPQDPVGTPPPGVVLRGDAVPGALRRVLPPLAEAGYVDCYRALHPDEPGFTYPAHAPWLRLDYVFAAPSLSERLAGCDVVADGDAVRASDHLPVRAVFR